MIKIRTCFQTPAVVGLICGVLMVCSWPFRLQMLGTPPLALFSFAILAILASCVVAVSAILSGQAPELAVRLGAPGGVWSVLSGAASFVLMERTVPLRALVIASACLMPAMLAGSVAAGTRCVFVPKLW